MVAITRKDSMKMSWAEGCERKDRGGGEEIFCFPLFSLMETLLGIKQIRSED